MTPGDDRDRVSRRGDGADEPAGSGAETEITDGRDAIDADASEARAEFVPSTSPSDCTVISRLRDVLGYEPAIDLRTLSSEHDVSVGAEGTQGKYVIERVIGEGGMGKVYLAVDRDLRRPVALKVIKDHLARDSDHLARFVEEAQVTGQLEHPGIPPVHEIAMNQNGEVFFTLKLLRGRTLKEVIHDVHVGRRETRERFTRKRLLQVVVAVANAVHFAHEKGVVHRDIKPANIMIGDFGEVQLMDWGLAKVIGERREEVVVEPVETVRSEQQMSTLHGQVRGTLQYMAPEQAQGRVEFIDRRSDVYSLGATLYEVLTMLPPKTGGSLEEILEESRLGLVIPPTVRAPKQRIPSELEEICVRALEYHPDDRYETALEFAESIQVYLDGTLEEERRRAESERLLKEALQVLREHEIEKGRQQKAAARLEDLERTSGHYPSPETKRELLRARGELDEAELSVARLGARAQSLLSASLTAHAENARARRTLGDLYLERFLRAERERNQTDMIFYQGLIEQVNDGSFDRVLKGDGALVLASEPRNARLVLRPVEERDGRLLPGDAIAEATDRLELPDLAMGSYCVELTADNRCPTLYPVFVERNQTTRDRIELHTRDRVPERFVYIPRGSFIMYGDPNVVSTFQSRARVQVEGFAIGRYPVTCGEYLEFLSDLHRRDPDEAERRAPRESEAAGIFWSAGADGYSLPEADRYPWSTELPIFGVSFADALAYCAYIGARDGRTYDLPTEAEWEKAAKGVDGRYYSWGNVFDNEFANNLYAREHEHGVQPVDSYPADCSPYGVRGMVGNVADWCYFEGAEPTDMVAVRGGNWALTGDPCRLSVRRSTTDRYVSDRIGFRVKLVL